MADAPPGVEVPELGSWSIPELQAKLNEIGYPTQGVREELIERLKNYSLQNAVVLTRPLRGDDMDKGHQMPPLPGQVPGMQLPPRTMGLSRMPHPPGMQMAFPMGVVPAGMGPRLHMPSVDPSALSEEERLKLAQQQAAILIQQEERVKQAAALLEQERQQQEMVQMHQGPPGSRPMEIGPRPALGARVTAVPMSLAAIRPGSVAATSLSAPNLGPRIRGPPPPPGEENRENDDGGPGPRIPQVLEKILQLKEQRQVELTASAEASDDADATVGATLTPADTEEEEVASSQSKKEKNRKRRNRKKKKKSHGSEVNGVAKPAAAAVTDTESEVEVEYVTAEPEIFDTNFIYFKRIFETFRLTDDVKKDKDKEPDKADKLDSAVLLKKKGLEAEQKGSSDEDEDVDSDEDVEKRDDLPKLSKKKLRRLNRLSVAELKQLVARPDVVEMHDVTAHDPKLLVHLKATRNSVPVPRHWCFKRKYLQGKRGIEKPPFELPEFIRRTGIQEMREALQEKEEQKTMKTKMREKVRPKMGKIDIDYQKLHDAFFKWQTKPKLTIHGDLYYEGKEFETRLKEKKPGDLSDELRLALGMPVGANAHKVPPPWLIAMQRYGPPPSYPNLKIPGLNSPIPESCSFGYHAGGWGKPPVDETGKPLYGDVFGTNALEFQAKTEEEELDRTPWGELEPSDEESSEEEEEEDESDEDKPDDTGFITPADSGLITPGGFSSVPAGMETPELIELRKKKIEEAMDGGDTPQLYIPVPEKRAATIGGAMMGSTHIYDMSAVISRKGPAPETQGIEVALAPEELELDPMAMTQKYEERVREQQAQVEKEDFSDMVAEHAAKQKQKKRKAQPADSSRGTKKYKEFKF
ncbi:splicing factor 3B subunit 2 isoform X2 [Hemiscyllium ocellatum]|uniref:splicing factor 3B subunit 2 isoform X2 n=1 Tax=Hemiscyllium ocellatum TaxID=170820 RepID=UPI002966DF4C|nr:splicing factor 3B subunit 2 isoform X2 [Hemiscyllium ocellatum]